MNLQYKVVGFSRHLISLYIQIETFEKKIFYRFRVLPHSHLMLSDDIVQDGGLA